MPAVNYTDLKKTELWKEHKASHSIFHPAVITKMWIQSSLLALFLVTLFLIYIFIQTKSFTLLTISMAVAATAAVMIGLSFSLSGFCYYFNFLDTKIGYRKYLGLVGYWLALTYSCMLLIIDPDRYLYGFFDNLLSIDFSFGLTAISILTFMAIISNNWAMKRLGVTKWRYGLRLGYLAYLLLISRAAILEHEIWLNWINNPVTLPPVRLIIVVFALFVLLLRLSMIVRVKPKV